MHSIHLPLHRGLSGNLPLTCKWARCTNNHKCIDAPTFVWSAEIFPTALRAKGVSLAIFAYFAGTITFSTPAAVALQSM